jgi:exodeoxyribonuclease-1
VLFRSLELITKLNGIDHFKAHDALSDVEALIAVTKLIKDKQPALYNHLFKFKDKNTIKQLVNLDVKQPFVYVSGRYDATYHKATVAFPLTSGRNGAVVVYDLRHDPTPFIGLSQKELEKIFYTPWEERQKEGYVSIPVKELQYNRAPAVAPLGVLARDDGWGRIGLNEEIVKKHRDILLSSPEFAENIRSIIERRPPFVSSKDPEAQLYDAFLPERDVLTVAKVRQADEQQLADLHPEFIDERLDVLLLHYKARNFPRALAEDEVGLWERWRADRLQRQMPAFVDRLQKLAAAESDENKQFILQELQLWAESIIPLDTD